MRGRGRMKIIHEKLAKYVAREEGEDWGAKRYTPLV